MSHLSFGVLFDALVYVCKSEKYKKVEDLGFNLVSEHGISGEALQGERFSRVLVVCFLALLFFSSFTSIV